MLPKSTPSPLQNKSHLFDSIQEKIRGPNLEFEHLERELSNSSVWPPLGKNNDIKVGK